MPVFEIDEELIFPPVELAEPDGLLAVGGDLSTERLLLAYRSGIFPWYEGSCILWWSPDPRFVLFPAELKVSQSMKAILRKNIFRFTVNENFPQVIRECKMIERKGQYGTWITDEMELAYLEMNRLGHAVSAETWSGDELVGGLYGVRVGKIFFGESMFSKMHNASKFALVKWVQQLQEEDVKLVDCQIYTQHLESLGARMISRKEFIKVVKENTK